LYEKDAAALFNIQGGGVCSDLAGLKFTVGSALS
jgi:hypothetical protein